PIRTLTASNTAAIPSPTVSTRSFDWLRNEATTAVPAEPSPTSPAFLVSANLSQSLTIARMLNNRCSTSSSPWETLTAIADLAGRWVDGRGCRWVPPARLAPSLDEPAYPPVPRIERIDPRALDRG